MTDFRSVSGYTGSAGACFSRNTSSLFSCSKGIWICHDVLAVTNEPFYFYVFLLLYFIKTHPTIFKFSSHCAICIFSPPRTYSTQTTERSTRSTQLLTSGKRVRGGLSDWQLIPETTETIRTNAYERQCFPTECNEARIVHTHTHPHTHLMAPCRDTRQEDTLGSENRRFRPRMDTTAREAETETKEVMNTETCRTQRSQ